MIIIEKLEIAMIAEKMPRFLLRISVWRDLPPLRTYGSEQGLLRLLQSGPPI